MWPVMYHHVMMCGAAESHLLAASTFISGLTFRAMLTLKQAEGGGGTPNINLCVRFHE